MTTYKLMEEYIEGFPQYLLEGLQIGKAYTFIDSAKPVSNVVMAGLGGSGIGAEIVINYINKTAKIPVLACKDYFLPEFVDERTLVVICSNSGDTEETIYAMKEALEKNANIVCITSGGKIAELAKEHHLDCIKIPSGMPPRVCLNFSITQLLTVLHHFGIIDDSFEKSLADAAAFLQQQEGEVKAYAKDLAEKMKDKMPIIYVDQHISGVGTRWRQQFNENSKILGWERVIPEMNHNEMVGWRDKADHLVVLFLRTGMEMDRVVKRFEINKKIVSDYTSHLIDVYAKGKTYWQKAMYLILLGDWISWYLAQQRGVDAVEVKVIDFLKSALNG